MSAAHKSTLAFFGATGGCAANALAASLRAGLTCVAMVRTPAKLYTILADQHNIRPEILDKCLVVVKGNIKSIDDVKRALTATGRLPDRILFTVGGVAHLQWNLWSPVGLDDPHICEDGMKVVLSALRDCEREKVPFGSLGSKPVLLTISTISMSNQRDLPYLLYPVEYWLLRIPRADKKAMEDVIFDAVAATDSPLGGFAMVRPPLLSEGQAVGLDKVKAGWVWPDFQREKKLALGQRESGPLIGFFVTKADVGAWIFENLIQGNGQAFGKCWNLLS